MQSDLWIGVVGDTKLIVIKNGANLRMDLSANDDGEFTYICSEIDGSGNETVRSNTYNIPIQKGDSFVVNHQGEEVYSTVYAVSSEDDTAAAVNISESFSKDKIPVIEILADTSENVYVYGEGSYLKGDMVRLSAPEITDKTFIGWFKDDELISSEADYSFTAVEDLS